MVGGLARLSLIRVDRGVRHRELFRQGLSSLMLFLQRPLELHGALLRSLLQLAGIVSRLGCQCRLRLDVRSRRCWGLLEPAGPLACLLEGFSRVFSAALRRRILPLQQLSGLDFLPFLILSERICKMFLFRCPGLLETGA